MDPWRGRRLLTVSISYSAAGYTNARGARQNIGFVKYGLHNIPVRMQWRFYPGVLDCFETGSSTDVKATTAAVYGVNEHGRNAIMTPARHYYCYTSPRRRGIAGCTVRNWNGINVSDAEDPGSASSLPGSRLLCYRIEYSRVLGLIVWNTWTSNTFFQHRFNWWIPLNDQFLMDNRLHHSFNRNNTSAYYTLSFRARMGFNSPVFV